MPEPGRSERLGVLGGTFDPPHRGHLAAAEAARRQLGLDRVLMVVAGDPWQKAPLRSVTPAEDRLAMVAAAVEGHEGLEVSRMEIDRGGPSYTVETVEQLLSEAELRGDPPPEIFVVVGADLVPGLASWERVDDLARLATLAVVTRPQSPEPDLHGGWRTARVEGGGVDLSSSALRERLEAAEPVGDALPDPVVRCISRRALYAKGR